MNIAFILLFQNTSESLQTNPWVSFLIVTLALGLAVYGARIRHAYLALGGIAVALIFGAVAAYSTSRALEHGKKRAEALSIENAQLRSVDEARQEEYDLLLAERDSLRKIAETLPPGKKVAVKSAQNAATAVKPTTYSTPSATPKKKLVAKGGTSRANPAVPAEIRNQYEKIGKFADGLAPVKAKGGLYGYIDKQGNVVVAPVLRYACQFHNGMAGVKNEKGLWGFVNQYGQLAVDFAYGYAFAFEKNKEALVSLKGEWVWINTEGTVLRKAKKSEWELRLKNTALASR